jgi:high-affinity iron transporter
LRTYLILIIIGLFSTQDIDQQKFRSLVNLSNYIANDYPNAVAFDTIINEFEYAEMQEFVSTMQVLHGELEAGVGNEDFKALSLNLEYLKESIWTKADAIVIQDLSNEISSVLLAQEILNNVPSTQANITTGRQLYLQNCAYCHGDLGRGDGLSSIGLVPAPSNFLEAQHIFPFHIYNTIQLGIEGTSMAAQTHLSEQETWDLSFYVMTLTYEDTIVDASRIGDALGKVDLASLSNQNNSKLESLFDLDGQAIIKALRFQKGEVGKEESLALTLSMLRESMAAYHEGNAEEANQLALDAYFIGFEPVEIELGATSPGKVVTIEKEMMIFRSLLNKPNNDTLVKEQYDKIAYHFDIIENEKEQSGFWFVFIASFSILMREGMEALLIIVAILAALNTFTDGEKAKKYVHGGWIVALLIGFISYFFAGKLIAMGAHKRELIEGLGALLAVVILLSVGFWLHDKSNAIAWNKFVKSKLSKHLNANSLWSVALLAFVVVFREAFESVIFLSSLSMAGGSESGLAVFLGSLFAAGIIAVIGVLIIKFSKRLPIHQVFKISSITMIILAVILAGRGIKELQEAAFIGLDLFNFRFSIDALGFYPTYQTMAAQIITLLIALGLWFLNKRKASKLEAA